MPKLLSPKKIKTATAAQTYKIIRALLAVSTNPVREAIKTTTKLWTLSKHGGGVSGAAKLFIEKRYGHVFRGGGQRASSKVIFFTK